MKGKQVQKKIFHAPWLLGPPSLLLPLKTVLSACFSGPLRPLVVRCRPAIPSTAIVRPTYSRTPPSRPDNDKRPPQEEEPLLLGPTTTHALLRKKKLVSHHCCCLATWSPKISQFSDICNLEKHGF
jgi:hypothetical protein